MNIVSTPLNTILKNLNPLPATNPPPLIIKSDYKIDDDDPAVSPPLINNSKRNINRDSYKNSRNKEKQDKNINKVVKKVPSKKMFSKKMFSKKVFSKKIFRKIVLKAFKKKI